MRLGEAWLRQVFDQQHPFMDLVWNRAAWTRVRMTELADSVGRIDRLPNGERLVDRFVRADQYSGAVLELDLAASALRKRLIVELEPQTRPGRRCDVAISQPGFGAATTLFLEVQSVQDYSDDAKRDLEVIELLAPWASWIRSNRELLGEIYRIPTDAELERLLQVTGAFSEECEASAEPEHLQLEDVMDVWAIPFGHPIKAELVAAGVPGSFGGPLEDDPLRRTVRAIRQKIGQLPTLAPGMIVIRPPRLLILTPSSLPAVVSAVRRAIAASPQVSAVALIHWVNRSPLSPPQARVHMAGAVIVHQPDRHIFLRQVVLIHNPVRRYAAGDAIIHRLF